MSPAKLLTAFTLAALVASCSKLEPTPTPKQGPAPENCVAFNGSKSPEELARLYVKLSTDLETVGLEFNGINAAGTAVFVPQGICSKKPPVSTFPLAMLALKNGNYTRATCGEPPIEIQGACINYK